MSLLLNETPDNGSIKSFLSQYNLEKPEDRKVAISRDFDLVKGSDARIDRKSKYVDSNRFLFIVSKSKSVLPTSTLCCTRCFWLFVFSKGGTTTSVDRHHEVCYAKEIAEEKAAVVISLSISKASVQQTLNSAFNVTRQDNLNQKVMRHIVTSHLPFNIVNAPEFLEVIQACDDKLVLPSLEKLHKSIDAEVLKITSSNAAVLRKDTFFNIDFDMWDGGQYHLLCLNAFCITPEFGMRYILLDVREFEGSHSGKQ